jgi:hypothetical protein
MSYVAFALGAAAGLLGGIVAVAYKRFRKRPNRLVPVEARRRRSLDQQALALAFATLYTRYADEMYPHFVLAQDRELVSSVLGDFFRENRDRLGEMHVGPGFFAAGENELIKNTVNKAIELFLQI